MMMIRHLGRLANRRDQRVLRYGAGLAVEPFAPFLARAASLANSKKG